MLVGVAAVWAPVAGHGLVWDDLGLLQKKASVQALDWAGMARTALWADVSDAGEMAPFFRPLTVWSFGVDQALSGMRPSVVHLHSLGWHLAAVALVMASCRRFGPWAVALSGVLAGLHPIAMEPVAFAAARNDGMAAVFGLLALAASYRARWVGVAVAVALAGFSKEAALVLPAVVWMQHRAAGRPQAAPVLAAGVGVAAVLAARAACGVGWPGAAEPDARQLVTALATMWGWLAWPLSATATANVGSPMAPLAWALACAAAVAGAVALVRAAETERWRVGAALLVLVTCAPAVAQTGRVASRYAYLSWLLLVPAVVELATRRRAWLPGMTVAAAALGAWGVGARLPEWQDERTLFTAAVARAPDAQAWFMRGEAERRAGDRRAAFAAYGAAVAYDGGAALACVSAARTAWSGTPAEARGQVMWLARPERGCRGVPGVDDQLLWSLAARGEWAIVRELLPGQTVSDGSGRSQAVRGAVRLADGDWQALSQAAMRNPAGAGPYLDAAYGVALSPPVP